MRIDSIYCDFVCGIDGKTVGKPFACAGCQEQRTWVFTPWELRGDSFAVKSPCSTPGSQHHLEFCLTRQSSVKSVFLLTRCSRPVPGSSRRRSEGVASESVCPPPALAALASTPKPRHRHCLGGQTLTCLLSLDSLRQGGAGWWCCLPPGPSCHSLRRNHGDPSQRTHDPIAHSPTALQWLLRCNSYS